MRPTQNGQPVLEFWVAGCWRSGGSTTTPHFVGSRESCGAGEAAACRRDGDKLNILVQPDSGWIVLALLPYLPSGSCKLDDGSLERLLRPFFTDTVLSIFTFLAVVALLFLTAILISQDTAPQPITTPPPICCTRSAFWRSGRAERRPVAKPWSWDAAHTTRENGSQKWAPPTWWCHRAWASLGGGELRSHGSIPKTKTRSAVPSFVCSRLTSKQPRFIEGVKPRPARCKAAAGVQRGAGRGAGKVHGQARGGAEPRHPHSGAFQLVTGHFTTCTPPQLGILRVIGSARYWLCTLVSFCSFLLSPSFPSSPPHVL
jgi:hypothetical protein